MDCARFNDKMIRKKTVRIVSLRPDSLRHFQRQASASLTLANCPVRIFTIWGSDQRLIQIRRGFQHVFSLKHQRDLSLHRDHSTIVMLTFLIEIPQRQYAALLRRLPFPALVGQMILRDGQCRQIQVFRAGRCSSRQRGRDSKQYQKQCRQHCVHPKRVLLHVPLAPLFHVSLVSDRQSDIPVSFWKLLSHYSMALGAVNLFFR